MRKNSVAVLDIRSSEVCAVVGERGVNGTFIIKSKYQAAYEGYAEGEIIDVESFYAAVITVVKNTISAMGGVKNFYVGVPGEFIKTEVVDRVLSFQSAKKITRADCQSLYEVCAPKDDGEYKTIRHGCIYYVLSDKRKVIDPVGAVSDCLHGKLCFYRCKYSFVKSLLSVLKNFSQVENIYLVPSNHAQAMYLVEPEQRDGYAVLLDLGYISSNYSVICGNGILYSESFSVGIGHIAAHLMNELEIPFPVAEQFLKKVNLNAKEGLSSYEECMFDGQIYKFTTAELRDIIREGLDGICETVEECRQNYTGKNIDGKPILITGEGVKIIRGTAEHLSNRFVNAVEIVAPKVPYYDKPHFSSLFSLLNVSLDDNLNNK